MPTITTENMQVCFVNTEQRPKKIVKLGLFNYSKDFNGKISFSELCEVFYPHPEAPDDAVVSMYQFIGVGFPIGFSSTATQCIDAMKGLESVKV